MSEFLKYPGESSNDALSPEGKAQAHTRRVFLFKLAVGLNAVVGAVLAVPLIGYLLGPASRKKSNVGSWINIGDVNDFPVGQTRLAPPAPRPPPTSVAPSRRSTMGKRRRSLAGCGVYPSRRFRCSPSTARIWAARCGGSRSRSYSSARATAARITRMAAERLVLRSAACSNTSTRLQGTHW
jgi:hypothetical protein